MKTATKENRASKEYAKNVFEDLYSDKDTRMTCARLLADSIFVANHISSSCWSVTLFPNKIRLNVGPVEVLVLNSDYIFLVVADSKNKHFNEKKYRDFVTESQIHYRSVQINQRLCYIPPETIAEFYPLIHENHRSLTEIAAKTRETSTWKSSFSPAVIYYLNKLLNVDLPMPSYFSDGGVGQEIQNPGDDEQRQKIGGGFGDPETNRKVEQAAISFVRNYYEQNLWSIKSVESEKLGYDLLCTKTAIQEHIEVKGVQDNMMSFIITSGEVKQSQLDKGFVLCVVTSALSNPKLHKFTAKEFNKQFVLDAIAYRATKQK